MRTPPTRYRRNTDAMQTAFYGLLQLLQNRIGIGQNRQRTAARPAKKINTAEGEIKCRMPQIRKILMQRAQEILRLFIQKSEG
ncbi:hypothetical protein SAMN04488036_103406 [Shimia haliotis]|uniref:Uncharacterized protein n=1 Tax=Shimia haliotis TaxID=1280847 RepID=A0A1I4DWM3_9RHOB|nr:hypothetical protein SAMN04488036_103406 [Shimia haliotis]